VRYHTPGVSSLAEKMFSDHSACEGFALLEAKILISKEARGPVTEEALHALEFVFHLVLAVSERMGRERARAKKSEE
jgi:hypothetical protein